MGTATREFFLEVLSSTEDILGAANVPHLVTGSIANVSHLGDAWDPGDDIDLLLTREDAERCLEIFPEHGYAVSIRDPSWIFKVARPNVTVDLIFVSGGRITLDEPMLAHAVEKNFESVSVPLPSVEDMAMLSVAIDSTERQGHWYDAMRYLELVDDWDYLMKRAHESAPAKALAALLYGVEIGIEVAPSAVAGLAESVFRHAAKETEPDLPASR